MTDIRKLTTAELKLILRALDGEEVKPTSKVAAIINEVKESYTAIATLQKRLKREGDLHLMNIKLFFDKWVEKSDPLRDAIKALVFGTIYGMSAGTLASNIRKKQLADALLKVKLLTYRIKELTGGKSRG